MKGIVSVLSALAIMVVMITTMAAYGGIVLVDGPTGTGTLQHSGPTTG